MKVELSKGQGFFRQGFGTAEGYGPDRNVGAGRGQKKCPVAIFHYGTRKL